MDPFAAIGLASSIITFVDLAQKVVTQANEIRKSVSGSTKDDQSTNILAEEMAAFALKLEIARPEDCTDENEKALARLAKECRDTSAEIQAVLEKRQLKGKQSFWHAIKAAARVKMTDEELLRLQGRLENHRAQLHLQLDHFKSAEYTKGLVKLLKQSETNVTKLVSLDARIADIQKATTVENLSQSALGQLQQIIGISTQAREQALAARLINSLSFADMGKRNNEVAEAHEDTFGWILSGNDPTSSALRPKDQAQAEARDQLQRWLREGSGVFHISGKLGSGKSTLMKFLAGEPRTRSLLQHWAGSRQLVMAEFFFWRPGTDLQKSLPGLFRSLLHSVLSNAPHLVKKVMDAEWACGLSKPDGQETDPKSGAHFTTARIRSLFQNLLQAIPSDCDHCFCFFIDGLDEFEETEHDDHDLVNILHQWARACPQSFKLCVSSREENIFMEMLGKHGRIRLHTATHTDISAYVSSRMDLVENLGLREELTTRIVAAAQGIFLWVSLVCRRIRRRYSSGYSREDLLEDINLLPQEINALFALLLDNQLDQDRDRAYLTLAIVLEADAPFFDTVRGRNNATLSGTEPTLLGYSFLEEYLQDPAFAIKAADDENQDLAPDPKSIADRMVSAEKRLNDCTQGLVELILIDDDVIQTEDLDGECDTESAHESRDESYPGTNGGPPLYRLGLTHRSVAEFLAQRQRRNLIEAVLSRLEFNALDALSAFHLAEIPFQNELLFRSYRYELLSRRYDAGLDSVPPFSFLEAYSKSMARRRVSLRWITGETRATYKTPAICHHTTVSHVSHDIRRVAITPTRSDEASTLLWVQDPIYIYAGFIDFNYVGWKLDRCSLKSRPSLADIQMLALLNHPFRRPGDHITAPHIIDRLFASGLDPGDCLPPGRHFSDLFMANVFPPAGAVMPRGVPIWPSILVHTCLVLGRGVMGHPREDKVVEAHLHTLERFIEAGADAHFRCRIGVWKKTPFKRMNWEYKFASGWRAWGYESISHLCDLRKLPHRAIQVGTVAELLQIILPAGERKDRLLRLLEERPKEDNPPADDDEWPVDVRFPEGWMEEVNGQDWDVSDGEDDEDDEDE
ncbi:hypothetical protein MAPG_09850 [Magnaporthiopsis poae ATCC 64411]|uniref:Nephrocystin 3-like N-terminal domain-containing protein n=1 Tax=Magnaporthiopsis poae (strain ATCC 64411 / 73-15) TaxID=644358 RepID=A0A0C4EB10_MAGP6|nr:hypothetical protein MAPG_09850 [Magnaporthiopsis poae ATCC 64411]